MKFNKNIEQVSYYYSMNVNAGIITREETTNKIERCKECVTAVVNTLKSLKLDDKANIKLRLDGFILKIDGHAGDIAWHEATHYYFETYGTVVDDDDVTRHDRFVEALNALLAS